MTTGRNFHEILRTIDSMQRTAKHKIATPADWKPGDDVIIVPKVTNEEAKKIYPDGWKTLKPYLRKVPDPSKQIGPKNIKPTISALGKKFLK